ncbi:hypothetical protein V6N13_001731 [Hibiscus sabdariffa]
MTSCDLVEASSAPPSNDALIVYLKGKFSSLNTRVSFIDLSIASLSTSFNTCISTLETRIGSVENSLPGFHHEWRTLTRGDGDVRGYGDDDDESTI